MKKQQYFLVQNLKVTLLPITAVEHQTRRAPLYLLETSVVKDECVQSPEPRKRRRYLDGTGAGQIE